MQRNTKKILIVAHYYPPHTGGIEYVAQNQAKALATLGYEVAVVTSRVSKNEHNQIENGVTVTRVKAINSFERWGIPFPVFSPRLIFVLLKAVRNAEVVHIHDALYISSWCAVIVARMYKRPVVLTQHIDLVPHSSRLVRLLQRIVYATIGTIVFHFSGEIFTLNERIKTFLTNRGVDDSKITLIPNGVDGKLFHPASISEKRSIREKYKLAMDKKIILFVGRIVSKKGADKVLAAESKLYQLVFVGGNLKKAESSNVRFLGKLPQTKLAEIYRAADIFVLPSHGEGFPLTVQEAMASGLPVIMAYDSGYAVYKLNQDFVLLLSSRPSPELVKNAIQTLVDDDARCRRMARRSLNYVQQNFSWSHVAVEFDRIYIKLLLPKENPS
jgi:glycosyltransferase involved in cell wall biosynthesis